MSNSTAHASTGQVFSSLSPRRRRGAVDGAAPVGAGERGVPTRATHVARLTGRATRDFAGASGAHAPRARASGGRAAGAAVGPVGGRYQAEAAHGGGAVRRLGGPGRAGVGDRAAVGDRGGGDRGGRDRGRVTVRVRPAVGR